MSDELLNEIRWLKETVATLSDRVHKLEQRVTASPPASAPAASPSRPAPVVPKAAPKPLPRPVVATKAPGDRETFEAKFGRYWLNRIGITTLVLGIAFFILYTFQYFGPVMKIATGLAIASALLGLGVWLERRPSFQWYALGLIGGGWALLYFTTYAMHHIPTVRLIEQPWVDLVLLLAVAAGAVRHSLRYRSETITGLALLLGFITTGLSDITYFTLASSMLLIGALAWLVVRLRWYGLYLYGVIASYATYLCWVDPQIQISSMIAVHVATVSEAQFWLRAGFLAMYWITFHSVLFYLEEQPRPRRNALLTATLLNGLVFLYAALSAMTVMYADFRYLVALGVGALYVLSEPLARQRKLPAAASAMTLLGLSFITLAIPLKLSGRWISFLWTSEIALFAWLGLRYGRWSYRAFAMGLGLLVFLRLWLIDLWNTSTLGVGEWEMPWRLLIGCVGVGSFGVAAAAYRSTRFRDILRPMESQTFHLYFLAALIVLWTLTMVEAPERWMPLWWATESAAMVGLGRSLRDRVVRLTGMIGVGLSALVTWVYMMWASVDASRGWAPLASLGVIGWCAGLSWRYRVLPESPRFAVEDHLRDIATAVACALLTIWLWVEIDRRWLSLAWALEGLALVGLGFALRDKLTRVCGLSVFGVLVAKILFVDLAGAETIYRILSFIAAGAILLLASLVYARFSLRKPSP